MVDDVGPQHFIQPLFNLAALDVNNCHNIFLARPIYSRVGLEVRLHAGDWGIPDYGVRCREGQPMRRGLWLENEYLKKQRDETLGELTETAPLITAQLMPFRVNVSSSRSIACV